MLFFNTRVLVWAACAALWQENNQPVLGFFNQLLYQVFAEAPDAFTDIVQGNNYCTEDGCLCTNGFSVGECTNALLLACVMFRVPSAVPASLLHGSTCAVSVCVQCLCRVSHSFSVYVECFVRCVLVYHVDDVLGSDFCTCMMCLYVMTCI